jgi:hypothetical protein
MKWPLPTDDSVIGANPYFKKLRQLKELIRKT